MKNVEHHIDFLYRYVDGELTAREALYVEQQIATSKEWQDVYHGLLFADEQEIDVEESLNRLEALIKEKVNRSLPQTEKKETPIIPIGLKKWVSMAAAIAGFVVLSVVALNLINSSITSESGSQAQYLSRPSVYPEDQIQIIAPSKKIIVKEQAFEEEEITMLVAQTERNVIVDAVEVAPSASASVVEQNETLVAQTDGFSTPNSYSKLLARYGYRELNPTLLNTPRGASVEAAPANHYNNFSRNAMSKTQLADFKKEFEEDYIARFPFSVIVKASFVIDEKGKLTNFKIIESASEEATEVVKTLFTQKAQWQVPLNTYKKPEQQEVLSTVSFGNSIFIQLDFEE